MKKTDLSENVGWFLAFAGVSGFIFSLLHPKSRLVTKKFVAMGGGMAMNYVAKKYLPRFAQSITNIIYTSSYKK
jgi:hypothetical protein